MNIKLFATAAFLAFSTVALHANTPAQTTGQEIKTETGAISSDAKNVHQNKVVSHKSHKHLARTHQKKTAKALAVSNKRIVKNSPIKKSHKLGQTKFRK